MAKIREFCENYKNRATDKLKEDYLKENMKITTYLPFIKKVTLADKLARVTTLDKDNPRTEIKIKVLEQKEK